MRTLKDLKKHELLTIASFFDNEAEWDVSIHHNGFFRIYNPKQTLTIRFSSVSPITLSERIIGWGAPEVLAVKISDDTCISKKIREYLTLIKISY